MELHVTPFAFIVELSDKLGAWLPCSPRKFPKFVLRRSLEVHGCNSKQKILIPLCCTECQVYHSLFEGK